MSWALRSVGINEFSGQEYDYALPSLSTGHLMRAGDVFLEAYDMQGGSIWKWAGVLYCFCAYVFLEGTVA